MQDPSKPIWINKETSKLEDKPIIFVATPVHSECSIHFTQALLSFQQRCAQEKIGVSFALLKSSLVTQGRNLCVSNFMEESKKVPYTHFLFVDSDIEFNAETIFSMVRADKEVIAAPYPLKAIDWQKIHKRMNPEMTPELLSKMGFTWPIKLENQEHISVKQHVMEVSHAPTGCMLIKKQVFEKMIEAYPNLKINQPTIINGEGSNKPFYYNFFDTYHDPENKRYYGEDFGFCKRWTEIGGKCHLYVGDDITHIGEYRYTGNLYTDMKQNLKKID